jgi:hypothetical protein
MTRRDILQTAHEPFGDAFYYGPERLSKRFESDEDARVKSGFAESTYRTVMDRLENDGAQEVRFLRLPPLPAPLPFCPAASLICVASVLLLSQFASVMHLCSLEHSAMKAA